MTFVLLGSSPSFLGGPAGIIKIKTGEFIDSYGIGNIKKNLIREEIISNPKKYKELIFEWYKINGKEDMIRKKYLSEFPEVWCNENFENIIIPIDDTEYLKDVFATWNEKNRVNKNWFIQPEFKINNCDNKI